MKIMKTNLLLLDNKIMKDEAENTVATDIPQTEQVEPQKAMNALMFKGLQNLMATPELANQVATVDTADVLNENEKTENEENVETNDASKSYAMANVNFKGNKLKTLGLATVTAVLANLFTSCKDVEEHWLPGGDHITNIEINMNMDALLASFANMQAVLTQMLMQQQLSYEQFNQYMQQMDAWRQSLENRLSSMEAVLLDMSNHIFNIDNGVQENNAYQQMIVGLLENVMTRDEAEAYWNKLLAEVTAGNKTAAEAMQEIINQLNLVNTNLSTIIRQLNDAEAQRKEQTEILKGIKGNTEAIKYQVMLSNAKLTELNYNVVNGNKQIVAAIQKADKNNQMSAAYLANMLGWSTSQVISYMNKLGIDLTNNATANKDEIVAAINTLITTTEKGNDELAKLRADFDAGRITAEQYASQMVEIMNSIDNTVTHIDQTLSQFVSDWAAARDEVLASIKDVKNISIAILKEEHVQTSELKKLNKGVYDLKVSVDKDREYLKKIYEKINSGSSLTAAEMEVIMKKLGGNISADLNDIKKLIVAELQKQDKQSAQLDALYKKLSQVGVVSNNILNEIKNIGDDLEGLDSINAKLDELIAAVKNLATSFNAYAKSAMAAHAKEIEFLNGIKAEIKNLGSKLQTLINQANQAEVQRKSIESAIKQLTAKVTQIEAQLGRSITPEELDQILAEHDAANQEFYASLIKKSQVNPKDYEDVKKLLAEINQNIVVYQGESNKILLDILAAVKKLDKNAPDYNEKLNKIINILENMKFECNCKADCDKNKTHEGEIDKILG